MGADGPQASVHTGAKTSAHAPKLAAKLNNDVEAPDAGTPTFHVTRMGDTAASLLCTAPTSRSRNLGNPTSPYVTPNFPRRCHVMTRKALI